MLIGEIAAELQPALKLEKLVDVAEIGERRLAHSGGTVVLRWITGLAGLICPGGLTDCESALRWFLGEPKDWSWVRILGRS